MLHPRSENRNETGEPSLRKKENRKRKSATKYPLNWMQPLREGRKEKEMVRETERPAPPWLPNNKRVRDHVCNDGKGLHGGTA